MFVELANDTNWIAQDDLLLLKKGGHSVYFGELGEQSRELIRYFEGIDAHPIELGDNPANWMLRELQEASKDYADEYLKSSEYSALKHLLEESKANQIESMKISYDSQFATTSDVRQKLMNKRLQKIYWRSPAYNLSRILVCVIIAFILGSVFLASRNPDEFTEAEVRAWLAVTFLCFIIIGILSITSVLPVMLRIRDIFYRHRAAGMLDNTSLAWALGTAEKWFIVLSSFFFCLVFIGVSGLTVGILKRSIRFWVSRIVRIPSLNSLSASFIHSTVPLDFHLGNFHFQPGNLLLFWTSLYVLRQQHANGSNSC